jgi:hypothetical protein
MTIPLGSWFLTDQLNLPSHTLEASDVLLHQREDLCRSN